MGGGPTSVAAAVAQAGEASAAAASGSTRGGRSGGRAGSTSVGRSQTGQANPIAAAMMTGGNIAETGNPNSPHGEISPQQASQIASLVNMDADNSVVGGFISGMPVIGNVVSLAEGLGLVDMAGNTPGIESSIASTVTDAYGGSSGLGGLISRGLGFSTVDPGVEAAMDAQMAGRMDAHNALMANRGHQRGIPETRRWYDDAAVAPGNGLAPGTTPTSPEEEARRNDYLDWLYGRGQHSDAMPDMGTVPLPRPVIPAAA